MIRSSFSGIAVIYNYEFKQIISELYCYWFIAINASVSQMDNVKSFIFWNATVFFVEAHRPFSRRIRTSQWPPRGFLLFFCTMIDIVKCQQMKSLIFGSSILARSGRTTATEIKYSALFLVLGMVKIYKLFFSAQKGNNLFSWKRKINIIIYLAMNDLFVSNFRICLNHFKSF